FSLQAEDGIRYFHVTGVQTCALPISGPSSNTGRLPVPSALTIHMRCGASPPVSQQYMISPDFSGLACTWPMRKSVRTTSCVAPRSEERRIGKEYSER